MNMARCEEGVSTRERIAVTGDALNITGRLKDIDEHFFLMLNHRTQKFEVHVSGQAGGTLGCELPFDALDARTIEYVKEHRASRMKAILRQMEMEEAGREREKERKLRDLRDRFEDGIGYLLNKRTTDEFPDEVLEGLNNDAQSDV